MSFDSYNEGMDKVVPGETHSDRGARSNVFMFGANVAF